MPYFPIWAHLYGSDHHHQLEDGAIRWIKKEGLYANHIEMSGTEISSIVSYGAKKNGQFRLNMHLAFPNLRLKPNHTRSNLRYNFKNNLAVYLDGQRLVEVLEAIVFDGTIKITTSCDGLMIHRTLYPSMKQRCFVEKIDFELTKPNTYHVLLSRKLIRIPQMLCVDGPYYIRRDNQDDDFELNENLCVYQYYSADRVETPAFDEHFLNDRLAFLSEMKEKLILETPDEMIDSAFLYSKVRVCESIFNTKKGLMHSPGGGGYYAAMWTNDQCEYVNPLFPFIGYDLGMHASINGYHLFGEYKKMPSSIISEGALTWSAAGDRGDHAMYAYGLGRFLLACGDKKIAESLIEKLMFSLQFCLNKKHAEGVILSDSDELENRLPSGKANLFTSSLVYDALVSMDYIVQALNLDVSVDYKKEAESLISAIETYFGAEIHGLNTYRYYKGNKKLRSWISIPLVMGIMNRKKETLDALFHYLWGEYGIRSAENRDIYWDRSTLYGLRAAFMGDRPNEGYMYLKSYTQKRLLGSHMPYPIEAFPEGNQKHLSGESGLYVRIFTEGLFGIRPIGFNKFICKPSMPDKWQFMNLRAIHLFDMTFDLEITKVDAGYRLKVIVDKKVYHQEEGMMFVVEMGL